MAHDSGWRVQAVHPIHASDMPGRFPRPVTADDIEQSRVTVPAGAVLPASGVLPEQPGDAAPPPATASNQSTGWTVAPQSQGPRPQPDEAPVAVTLGNATRTSQGNGPGVLALPRAEAVRLVGLGLARPA
jgi:hypothetical protein